MQWKTYKTEQQWYNVRPLEILYVNKIIINNYTKYNFFRDEKICFNEINCTVMA